MPTITETELRLEQARELYALLVSMEVVQKAIDVYEQSQKRNQTGAECVFCPLKVVTLKRGEHEEKFAMGLEVSKEDTVYRYNPCLWIAIEFQRGPKETELLRENDEKLFEEVRAYIIQTIPDELVSRIFGSEGTEESKVF